MKKNLKNSILFILITITLISVVILFSTASKPVSIDAATINAQKENSLKSVKWSGLGMGIFSINNTSTFDGYVDTLIANGFTNLRIDIPTYLDTEWLVRSKTAVIRAVAKGANVIWGVSSNPYGSADYTITAENWPAFRQAILDAAQWAQDNGVYEFQLGNEEDMHIWRHPVSITRINNVATATFAGDHGYTADNPIHIWNSNPASFNYNGTITVTGAKTFTYPSAGSDGACLQ